MPACIDICYRMDVTRRKLSDLDGQGMVGGSHRWRLFRLVGCNMVYLVYQPSKINMEHKNHPIEGKSSSTSIFGFNMLTFQGVTTL